MTNRQKEMLARKEKQKKIQSKPVLKKILDRTIEKKREFSPEKLLGAAQEEISKDLEILKILQLKNNEIEDVYQETEEALIFNETRKKYGDSLYTAEQLKEICVDYNLRLRSTEFFLGKVPYNIVSKIKDFCTEHDIDLKVYASDFKILAPAESFSNSDVEVDPMLLFRANDTYYIPVVTWGKELSIWRYIKSIPERSEKAHVLSYIFIGFVALMNIAILIWGIGFGSLIWSMIGCLGGLSISNIVREKTRWKSSRQIWNTGDY